MLAGNPAYFFRTLTQQFGDFLHYRGLFSFYLVNHPSLVKQVLMETHRSYDKNTILYKRLTRVFGNGLVVSEGDDWKRQRKMMQPMFGPITVHRFFDSMAHATSQTLDRWSNEFSGQKVFNIATEMEQLTLRIAGEALFSEGFTQHADRIAQWNHRINFYCAKPPLPIIRDFWFPSTVNRRLKATLREFHQFIGEMIDKRRSSGSQNDLLSILLEAKYEDGQPLTDLEVREQILGMILGGHETSSRALTWVWHELDRNPDKREKLYAEIDTVIGDGPITLDHLPRLRYTKMVIDECMRLHPPFWFENRNVMHDDVQLGGRRLAKGSLVIFTRYALHRHPEFWNNPDAFVPERQDPDQPENKRSVYAQVPFGGGPRICSGINFAIMELVVVVAEICRRFHVTVAKENKHQMAAKMTMFPKFGVKAQLQRRSQHDNAAC